MCKAAIVTTLKNTEAVVESFIRYHLSIGFDHIFLFFDDPTDTSINAADKYKDVTTVKSDRFLQKEWKETKLYKDLGRHTEKEVMARQMLNVCVATKLAVNKNFDWLLHLDSDELFYSPNVSVREHFRSANAGNITSIRYLNYEAICEQFIVRDYFREVTLFKSNIGLLSDEQRHYLFGCGLLKKYPTYFNYYSNGKSAARIRPDLVPASVHDFSEDAHQKRVTITNPAILHYPVCGFNYFLCKYRTLGNFDDYWWNGATSIKDRVPFHLHARDTLYKKSEVSPKQFYKQKVMMIDDSVKDHLIRRNIFKTITLPSEILRHVENSLRAS